MHDSTFGDAFAGERHFIDATSWDDMYTKSAFVAASGRKDAGENFPYLPTKIFDIENSTIPLQAQWNYRIACHHARRHIPLTRIRMLDDLSKLV